MIGYKRVVYSLILNIYVATFASCYENILSYSVTHGNYSTVTCINTILTRNFRCGTLTTFVNPSRNIDQVVQDANKNICHTIIVRSFDDRNWFIWANVYVITVEDSLELLWGMVDLTRDVFWNPRAKFIVEVNNVNDDEGVRELFKILLKYNIYDVILIRRLESDAMIYTYNPFLNNNCGKHFDEVIIIGTCENADNIVSYFPKHAPMELKNCTIKVVASDDVPNFISRASNYTVYGKFVPGLEQYVLDTIAKYEGFHIDYEVFSEDEVIYGIVLPNKTSTGLLSYIDDGKADVAAGGYILMANRVELFDYLYGFNYASYKVFTPAVKSHSWKRVYREFGILTWLLIGGALMVVITVSSILKYFLNDKTLSILNVWGYFLGNANAGMSRNRRFRMIIFCWSWFTFFISNFYNTALFSLITVHVHETPHYITADNLKSLPFKPCISENTRMYFQFAFNQIFPEGEEIHNCTYTDAALRYVALTKKYYAIEMEYSYSLKEYEYMDKEGKHELESWIFSSHNVIVIYLIRGFPFKQIFQQYANRMFEGGLIKNHLKTLHLRSYSVIKRHPKSFKNTTISDLRMHFFILLTGYALSFICFLLEIWYHYVKQEEKLRIKTK